MTFAVFHDYPGLEYGLPKLHDFPGPVLVIHGLFLFLILIVSVSVFFQFLCTILNWQFLSVFMCRSRIVSSIGLYIFQQLILCGNFRIFSHNTKHDQ